MREPGWITKAEAAQLLGVEQRTIERRARAGRIDARARPGFPTLYRQADVEILLQGGSGEVRTGILEPGRAGNGNGAAGGLVSATPREFSPQANEDLIRQFFTTVVQALHAPIGPTGPTAGPTGPTAAYVDKAEALAIAGV